MPCFNYTVSVFFRKFLCSCKISNLETMRFSQLYPVFNIKDCFRSGFPHMHMNRPVIIAVKPKFKTILFKDNRHGRNILHATSEGDIFLRTSAVTCHGRKGVIHEGGESEGTTAALLRSLCA